MKKKIANYIKQQKWIIFDPLSKMFIVYMLCLAVILFISDIFSCGEYNR